MLDLPRTRTIVGVLLLLLLLVALPLLSATGRPREAAAASPCDIELGRTVAPDRTIIDQQASVTMTIQADCGELQAPIHLALVVDNSIHVGGPRVEGLRQGVATLVDGIDLSRSLMGIAVYNSRAEILEELTDDREALLAAAQTFFPRQGSNVTMGLRAGHQMLQRARPPEGAEGLIEVLIVVVAGPNDNGPEEVVAEAQKAKDEGVIVVTVAAGGAADYDMLESAASSSNFFYVETISGRYPSLFREILADVSTTELTGALILDDLPDALEYSFGSGVPAPRLRDGVLSWNYAIWPGEGITITYRAACLELGRHASSEAATVELRFDRGAPVLETFPIADVECIVAPTATPVPTATGAPTAIPSASPSARPTGAAVDVFLPILWRRHCLPTQKLADVVLLLDVSSSMHQLAGGEIKLQMALDGASAFIDELAFPYDRAALVTFSSRADLLQPLSVSRVRLQLALARLFSYARVGSRVDLGLGLAREALAGRGRDEAYPGPAPDERRTPVIILLTDGLTDGPLALEAAASARAAGITLYTVGLGDEVDAALLRAMAGDPSRFFLSPDGAGLAAIYTDIARTAGCP